MTNEFKNSVILLLQASKVLADILAVTVSEGKLDIKNTPPNAVAMLNNHMKNIDIALEILQENT